MTRRQEIDTGDRHGDRPREIDTGTDPVTHGKYGVVSRHGDSPRGNSPRGNSPCGNTIALAIALEVIYGD